MTRLNALLLSLLLASLFGRVESWPWNFVACMACSICTLAIGLVIQSERPVVTGWSEAPVYVWPRARVIGVPTITRKKHKAVWS